MRPTKQLPMPSRHNKMQPIVVKWRINLTVKRMLHIVVKWMINSTVKRMTDMVVELTIKITLYQTINDTIIEHLSG